MTRMHVDRSPTPPPARPRPPRPLAGRLALAALLLLAGPVASAQPAAPPASGTPAPPAAPPAAGKPPAAAPGAGATTATPPPAPAPAASSRKAEAILGDFAKAVGGKEGLGRHKSVRIERKLLLKGMGITGTEERLATADGRFVSTTTLPGVGVMKIGATGGGARGTRWSQDPINGLRVLKGAEDEQVRIDATWNAELQLAKLFKQRKVVAPPAGAPRDRPLECVQMTPGKANPVTMCFDAQTHLRSYQEGRQSSPQGELPYSVRISDWRDVGGVKIPFKEEMVVGPMSLDGEVTGVQFDEKLDPARFRMPKAGSN